ncbi:tol-pal system protein YbgF [Aestuariibacter halophilus]|uniref:Cell division coordinator CpoB n=1 Tax=Fluctibacter halophilus TaxID=226011 RepID=A0ABS8G6R2_9ALTE|nr:tol-pal system protein YbgF [Aestuariibacter halophilus]MCC2616098.1 tol-pal system protein YbgF [Aestuariibacter halophilus]
MKTYRSFAFSLLMMSGAAVYAAPAPVTDLNGVSADERIATIERIIESREQAQHRIQQQLDMMQDEVNELRGTLEVHNYQLEQILERQRELYLEIDKRIEAIMTQPASAAVNVPATSSAPETQPVANDAQMVDSGVGAAEHPDETAAYDAAVNLILRDKKYNEAVPAFQQFLQQYPGSSYTPNAHYWLGQLLFNQQDWAGAGQQFGQLVDGYADSNKRPDAMFKLGVVAQKRNNLARAKQLFEQVIAEYPDSASRKLAEARLKSLAD